MSKKIIAVITAAVIFIIGFLIGGNNKMYYVFDDNKCKFEAMTKEEVINAIAEATGKTPKSIDEAFVTKLKETNTGKPLQFWIGTHAEYNALEKVEPNTLHIITDADDIDNVKQAASETATEVATTVATNILMNQFEVLYEGRLPASTEVPNLTAAMLDNYKYFIASFVLTDRTIIDSEKTFDIDIPLYRTSYYAVALTGGTTMQRVEMGFQMFNASFNDNRGTIVFDTVRGIKTVITSDGGIDTDKWTFENVTLTKLVGVK